MTENEAIKILKRDLKIQQDNKTLIDGIEALQVAIKALEEIQQYREIGTVEDITEGIKQSEEEFNMLTEYLKIGTIDEFKALKEKNVAKKMDRYYCPICRHYFEDGEWHNYCPECGQKLG